MFSGGKSRITAQKQSVMVDEESLSQPPLMIEGAEKEHPRYQETLRRLQSKQNRCLSENLFWYQEFGSTTPAQVFAFPELDIFGNSLKQFENTLKNSRTSPSSLLELCILNTTPVSSDIFSWFHQLFATSLGRLTDNLEFPRYAVAVELRYSWDELSECAWRSINRPEQLKRVEHLSLHEYRRQFLQHSANNCKCKEYKVTRVPSHYDARRGVFQKEKSGTQQKLSLELPSSTVSQGVKNNLMDQCERIFGQDTASFTFNWQRAAPLFHGGFDEFLWERHSKPPACDYAEVFYQKSDGQPRRVLMTISTSPDWMETSPLLGDLKSRLDETTRLDEKETNTEAWYLLRELKRQPSRNGYALLPLLAVFEQVIQDGSFFVQRASDQIMGLNFAGRNAASMEKFQFLCHLDDCRNSAWLGLGHVHSTVESLLAVTEKRSTDGNTLTTEIEFLKAKKMDLEFLMARLEGLKGKIDELSKAIETHISLSQARQMSVLTYIATIWVPFAFVTGMLGMNISNPGNLFGQHTKPEDAPALAARQISPTSTSALTSTETLVALLSNLTTEDAMTAAQTSTSPYIWSFGFFVGLAGVLFIFSIMLPLIGPNLLRITVQRSHKLRTWWIFWPFVFLFYYIIVYWAIPEITDRALQCPGISGDPTQICNKGNNEYFYLWQFSTEGGNNINTVSYVISAVVLGSIGMYHLAVAIMYRRGPYVTLIWSLYAAIVIVCYFLDYYLGVEWNIPYAFGTSISFSALIPLAYLMLVWTIPFLLEKWKGWKTSQEKKVKSS